MNGNQLSTRLATPADAPSIAAIYNEGITLVATRGDESVAWASAGAYRNRSWR